MFEPEEDMIEETDINDLGDFDPDSLDLNELVTKDPEPVAKPSEPVPPFLSKLQWWGFAILLIFILGILIRMIFGPPWIDRFRHPRFPVAIDQSDGLVGVIIPNIVDRYMLSYHFVLADYDGNILRTKNLGRFIPGPVDLALAKDRYFYICGEGSWIAGRKYIDTDESANYDIDMQQFDWKLRNGIDILVTDDGREYLNVFNDDELITLSDEGVLGLWQKVHSYSIEEWGYQDFLILDLDRYYMTGQAGGEVLLLEFPNYVDGFSRPMSETLLTMVPPRPRYAAEFIYKPAIVSSSDRVARNIDCAVLKNDRMFNLPFKYMDDQLFIKFTEKIRFDPLRHEFFAGKDIRGFTFLQVDEGNQSRADYVIVYSKSNEFRLAALRQDREKPLWDISLTSIIESDRR